MRSEEEIERQDERSSDTVKAAGCFCLGPPAGCASLMLLAFVVENPRLLFVVFPLLIVALQPERARVRAYIEDRRGGDRPPARVIGEQRVNGVAVFRVRQPCPDGARGAVMQAAYLSAYTEWAEVRIPEDATFAPELEPLVRALKADVADSGDGRWRAPWGATCAERRVADLAMCYTRSVDEVVDMYVGSIRSGRAGSPPRERDVGIVWDYLSWHPSVEDLAIYMLVSAPDAEKVRWAIVLGDYGVPELVQLANGARSEAVRRDAMLGLAHASSDAAREAMWAWFERQTGEFDACMALGMNAVRSEDTTRLLELGCDEGVRDDVRVVALSLAAEALRRTPPEQASEATASWREALEGSLRYPSLPRLQATVDVLDLLGVRDVAAPLTDMLASTDRARRIAAANALARIGGIAATPALRAVAASGQLRRYDERFAVDEALAAIYDREGTGEAGSLAIAEQAAGSLALFEGPGGELAVVEGDEA